ncbi:hypothetical protein CEXT_628031 [Caerostris extrusa]|uniref:Uncharacterized protein n=1 Tax=Caerostris extrusa TaxID=172846 RepID=A0AAV4UPU1_CAEEX|nr:hypothetical protein CEXT_628031 [Caerostris extrusa]
MPGWPLRHESIRKDAAGRGIHFDPLLRRKGGLKEEAGCIRRAADETAATVDSPGVPSRCVCRGSTLPPPPDAALSSPEDHLG